MTEQMFLPTTLCHCHPHRVGAQTVVMGPPIGSPVTIADSMLLFLPTLSSPPDLTNSLD